MKHLRRLSKIVKEGTLCKIGIHNKEQVGSVLVYRPSPESPIYEMVKEYRFQCANCGHEKNYVQR